MTSLIGAPNRSSFSPPAAPLLDPLLALLDVLSAALEKEDQQRKAEEEKKRHQEEEQKKKAEEEKAKEPETPAFLAGAVSEKKEKVFNSSNLEEVFLEPNSFQSDQQPSSAEVAVPPAPALPLPIRLVLSPETLQRLAEVLYLYSHRHDHRHTHMLTNTKTCTGTQTQAGSRCRRRVRQRHRKSHNS